MMIAGLGNCCESSECSHAPRPQRREVSKKFENHMHMVALYTVWYNYVKQHKTLKGPSPAMAAGISDTLWSVTDLTEMVDASTSKPGQRGSYKKTPAQISN
jgi:hypothetical protein